MRKCEIIKSFGLVRRESGERIGALWEPSGQELRDGYSLPQDTPSMLSLSLSPCLPPSLFPTLTLSPLGLRIGLINGQAAALDERSAKWRDATSPTHSSR